MQKNIHDQAIIEAEWMFPVTLDTLARARTFVRWICLDLLCPPPQDDTSELLELAVNEAVSNIVIHAYGGYSEEKILMQIEAFTDQICIHIYHSGESFDPQTVPMPAFDGSQDHGFGLYMISKCVDQLKYFNDAQKGNAIRLIKKRNAV